MSKNEIEALADRLAARASSKLMDQCKHQQADLRRAAELLREYSTGQSTKRAPETDAGFVPVRIV